jgi:hypothetical protein
MGSQSLQSFSVEVFEAGCLCFEAEVCFGAAAAGGGKAGGQGTVGEETGDGLGEGVVVGGRDEQGSLVFYYRFGDARSAEAGDGQTDGLGFAECDGKALAVAAGGNDARRGQQTGAVHEVADDAGGLRPEEGAVAKRVARQGAQRIEQWAVADDEERRGGVAGLDLHHGPDDVVAAFFFDQTSDEEDDGVTGAGVQRVGREEVEVNSDGEGAELAFRYATLEGLAADVFGDANKESGACAEFGFAAQKDAAGCVAAQGLIAAGGVVTVEGDDHRDVELLLQRERGGGIDGEVRVQQDRMLALECANEMRGNTGVEEETAAELVGERIAVGEKRGFAGINEMAGRNAAEAGKAGSAAAQSMALRGNEGFRGRQEIGTIDEDGRFHSVHRGAGDTLADPRGESAAADCA